MKILFISPANRPDYQCDMLFHGLRELYGADVVDYPRLNYMYKDYSPISELYGRGFTLYGLLSDSPAIDAFRGMVESAIMTRHYDLIIYGSCHRSLLFLDLVVEHYERHEILFIDGEDQSHGLFSLAKYGLYFKRELASPHEGIHPIHFAIPVSKVGTIRGIPKIRVRAFIDPRDRSTYTYSSEHSYYMDYASSLFAFTMRKAGWDCLRHYEILANGCIPIFLDLDKCPATTLTNLPKPELLEALSLMDRDATYWDTEEGHAVYTSLWRRIHLPFVRYSTTVMMAQQVIETQEREAALCQK